MPYFADSLKRSWDLMFKQGRDPNHHSNVGVLKLGDQMPDPFWCGFAISNGVDLESCSLDRGEVIIIFKNENDFSISLAVEGICSTSCDYSLRLQQSGEEFTLETEILVDAAFDDTFSRGLTNFWKTEAPNLHPIRLRVANEDGARIPDDCNCQLELRCVDLLAESRKAAVAKIRKSGRRPYLKASKVDGIKTRVVSIEKAQ